MKISFLILCLILMLSLPGPASGERMAVNGFNNPALITSGDAFQRLLSDLRERFGQVEERLGPAEGRGRVIEPLELRIRPLGRVLTPLDGTISPLPRILRPLEGKVLRPLDSPVSPLNGGPR